jgi:hypothetical protein
MQSTADHIREILEGVNAQKTGERSEEQRKIAILATKLEDALAWAKHAYGGV